ncbi:MAG: hypothetical protein AABY32_02615 [Nanoarchaeota archaeon]
MNNKKFNNVVDKFFRKAFAIDIGKPVIDDMLYEHQVPNSKKVNKNRIKNKKKVLLEKIEYDPFSNIKSLEF